MLKVLRVSHSACVPAFRERDRALAARGIRLTLVLPEPWAEAADGGDVAAVPDGDAGDGLDHADAALDVRRIAVWRGSDVNRHRYADEAAVDQTMREIAPDLLDIHEEPFSVAARQWMKAARRHRIPVVLYTAQNIDKRFPPPFAQYEKAALATAAGVYPCSRQAASVVRGKGFRGTVEVLPLGYDPAVFSAGSQSTSDQEIALGLVGRMVPEKGVLDAVHVLAAVQAVRPARLTLIGSGPELESAQRRADELNVADRLEVVPWIGPEGLADRYRHLHVVLIPSTTTSRWAEQFGRVIVEGQASGAVVAGYASGSIPEVAGDAGVLVPEGCVTALCEAVLSLLTADENFDRRRSRGLTATRALTWARVAERQIAFYEKALADDAAQVVPSPSFRSGLVSRARARAEFGRPAPVLGQERPFALPVLRDCPRLAGVTGRLLDLASRG